MSYLNHAADPNRRTTAIAGVFIVHAAMIYLLVTGLITKIAPPPYIPFVGGQVPLPPPPPPKPAETPKPNRPLEKQVTPELKVDLTKTDVVVDKTEQKTDWIDVIPTPTPTPTVPPVTTRFKPRPASARNSPGSWAMTEDYPPRDLREGNEGVTAFRVVVGTNGRVSACEIVRSSGHPGLDAATCRTVTARARFNPATDENGNPVAGVYSNSVLWQIPR